VFAAIRLTNALLPALRESKAAAIVNISSGAATMAVGAVAHYGAAKAALNSYSRSLASDLAPSKIRVNVVSTGPVWTPGSREFSDAIGVGSRGLNVVNGHSMAQVQRQWLANRKFPFALQKQRPTIAAAAASSQWAPAPSQPCGSA
jgi:NAD(P)-dependent dehydrogenase (short-subunit alcohol dehydrogenase family)